jgi:activator of 2-hydroxyglutaryl-CoA dehydratase
LPDVVAGVQHAIATRVSALAGRSVSPPVYFTGGVALQPGMAHALAEVLGYPVTVVPEPLFTGALGAAILAGPSRLGSLKEITGLSQRAD